MSKQVVLTIATLLLVGAVLTLSAMNIGELATVHADIPTIIVAASNSSASDKMRADYVCDGINDNVEIQAAIDALTTGGVGTGEVKLLEGTFHPVARIQPSDSIKISGVGRASVIRKPDEVNSPLTADCVTRASSCIVADASGFTVGDDIVIVDDNNTRWSRRQYTITDISGNDISFTPNAGDDYTVAQNGYVMNSFPLIYLAPGVDDVEICELCLDGNEDNRATDETFTQSLLFCYGGAISSDDGYYHDLYLLNSNTDGICVCGSEGHSYRNRVMDNYAYNCGRNCPDPGAGIHLGGGTSDAVVKGNDIDGCENGIYFCALVTRSVVEANSISNCVVGIHQIGSTDTYNIVVNNTIYNCSQHGISLYAGPGSCYGNVVRGNIIKECGDSGIYLGHGPPEVIESVEISHNTIEGSGEHGIEVHMSTIIVNCDISHNLIRGSTDSGFYAHANAEIYGLDFIGNRLESNGSIGAYFSGTSANKQHVNIIGNIFKNNASNGLDLRPACKGAIVTGNVAFDDQETETQTRGIVIRFSDAVVKNNVCKGNGSGLGTGLFIQINAQPQCPDSPGELRVYDSQRKVTGVVNGKESNEIPNSSYYQNTVTILSPSDSYRLEIMATSEGSYNLTVIGVTEQETATFAVTDISTSLNTIHEYTISWNALSQGENWVTMREKEGVASSVWLAVWVLIGVVVVVFAVIFSRRALKRP